MHDISELSLSTSIGQRHHWHPRQLSSPVLPVSVCTKHFSRSSPMHFSASWTVFLFLWCLWPSVTRLPALYKPLEMFFYSLFFFFSESTLPGVTYLAMQCIIIHHDFHDMSNWHHHIVFSKQFQVFGESDMTHLYRTTETSMWKHDNYAEKVSSDPYTFHICIHRW